MTQECTKTKSQPAPPRTALQRICSDATATCRGYVEEPYYDEGNNPYDVRPNAEQPPEYFIEFLNLTSTQNALGVDMNYTADSSSTVASAFAEIGDFVFPQFIHELEGLLAAGVRLALYYGDADYICNWLGGEAVSLVVNYTHSTEFGAAGYTPFEVDGTEYGAVRQYGNFSFLRIYNSGHLVPWYQPKAALEMFRRVLTGKALANGTTDVTASYGISGDASATHTEGGSTASATGSTSSRRTTTSATRSSGSSATITASSSAVTPTQSKSAGNRRIKMF
jgi:carboxypeptidase C (cathepsin A)